MVTIVDNSMVECDESFTVSLSFDPVPEGDNFAISNAVTTVTITDDDSETHI